MAEPSGVPGASGAAAKAGSATAPGSGMETSWPYQIALKAGASIVQNSLMDFLR